MRPRWYLSDIPLLIIAITVAFAAVGVGAIVLDFLAWLTHH